MRTFIISWKNRLIFSAASAVWKKLTANTASRNALMCFRPGYCVRPPGRSRGVFQQRCEKINIDHHISNKGCGDVNYVVPTASSTSELIL